MKALQLRFDDKNAEKFIKKLEKKKKIDVYNENTRRLKVFSNGRLKYPFLIVGPLVKFVIRRFRFI